MKLCYSIEDVKKLVIEHAENTLNLSGEHLLTTVRDKYNTDFIEIEFVDPPAEDEKESI